MTRALNALRAQHERAARDYVRVISVTYSLGYDAFLYDDPARLRRLSRLRAGLERPGKKEGLMRRIMFAAVMLSMVVSVAPRVYGGNAGIPMPPSGLPPAGETPKSYGSSIRGRTIERTTLDEAPPTGWGCSRTSTLAVRKESA